MTSKDVEKTVLDLLAEIAPEADLATLSADADLRQSVDIDSFDFLRLVVRLHESLGVDIPESDYGRLQTLSGCVGYLTGKFSG